MIFQYPEYQLFETTVLLDAAYGPKNLGLSEEEALARAKEGLALAGLSGRYFDMSPFELSGGEKRRAAIAGVLAMRPRLLLMDEPTAGLDPKGRRELFSLIRRLNEEEGMTIVFVSHSMDDVANYADRVLVMQDGTRHMLGTPREVFSKKEELDAMHLGLPEAACLMQELAARGLPADAGVVTEAKAVDDLIRMWSDRSGVC